MKLVQDAKKESRLQDSEDFASVGHPLGREDAVERNLELVRKILLRIEESKEPSELIGFSIEGYSKEQLDYHCNLLKKAGMIDTEPIMSAGVPGLGGDGIARPTGKYIITGLTWEGHEFLDLSKSDKLWNKAKTFAKKTTGSIALGVLKKVMMDHAITLIDVALKRN